MSEDSVVLTERAAKRVATILDSDGNNDALRIAVAGGGCSGFQYTYDLTTGRNEDDLVLQRDGATVLIDSVSLQFMGGAEIDFVDDLIGQSFQIRNPNAVAACGCGTSFTV